MHDILKVLRLVAPLHLWLLGTRILPAILLGGDLLAIVTICTLYDLWKFLGALIITLGAKVYLGGNPIFPAVDVVVHGLLLLLLQGHHLLVAALPLPPQREEAI